MSTYVLCLYACAYILNKPHPLVAENVILCLFVIVSGSIYIVELIYK